MGLLDTILGRSKPVKADIGALFALPAAAITLQVDAGYVPSGHAGVCFKPPAGPEMAAMQSEIQKLVDLDPDSTMQVAEDSFGYRWMVIGDPDLEELVNQVHLVDTTLSEAGFGPQLLCAVFGVSTAPAEDAATPEAAAPPAVRGSTGYLVYLFKRGTFYPFMPTGAQQRNTEEELRVKGALGGELPVEADLDRWFPLWDLPVA